MTAEDATPDFLTTVLSTITSRLPLDVIIDYDDVDVDRVRYLTSPGTFTCPLTLKDEITKNVLRYEQRFKLFREMYRVRGFRLVLCADVFNHSVGPAVQTLERLVRAEKEKGRLDYLRCKPLTISEKRTLQTHAVNGKKIGWNRQWYLLVNPTPSPGRVLSKPIHVFHTPPPCPRLASLNRLAQ